MTIILGLPSLATSVGRTDIPFLILFKLNGESPIERHLLVEVHVFVVSEPDLPPRFDMLYPENRLAASGISTGLSLAIGSLVGAAGIPCHLIEVDPIKVTRQLERILLLSLIPPAYICRLPGA